MILAKLRDLVKHRAFFFGLFALVVLVLVFLKVSDLKEIGENFLKVHPAWLAAAVFSQFGTYLSDSESFAISVRWFGMRVPRSVMVRAAIVIEFLNDITPSFGMSSNIYLAWLLRNWGLSLANSALVLMLQNLASFLAFTLVLMAGSIYLYNFGGLSATASIAALSMLAVAGAFWSFVLLIFLKESWTIGLSLKAVQVSSKYLKIRFSTDQVQKFIADLREGRQQVLARKRLFVYLLLYKLGRFAFDSLTVYLLFVATRSTQSFPLAMVGYAAAVFLSTISMLPGGVGSFEVTMVVVYNRLGVSLETAGVVTLMFRALSFWLPIPLGLWFFRKGEASRKAQAEVPQPQSSG